jgi:hypothetical protein
MAAATTILIIPMVTPIRPMALSVRLGVVQLGVARLGVLASLPVGAARGVVGEEAGAGDVLAGLGNSGGGPNYLSRGQSDGFALSLAPDTSR